MSKAMKVMSFTFPTVAAISVKTEYLSDGTSYTSTNGIVDNEDIYGPNDVLDEGEDVIDFGWDSSGSEQKKGTLQKDTAELPTTGIRCCTSTAEPDKTAPIGMSVGVETIDTKLFPPLGASV